MTDPQIKLYHYPGACSMVTVCALEMTGLPYSLELVDLGQGGQLTPAYLEISPLGKVPYMIIDGEGMAENVGLIAYLAALRPSAGIFPAGASARGNAEAIGGLAFCSGTLHPIVRGMFNPGRLTTGDTAGVREMAAKLAKKSFGHAEQRLAATGWWFEAPSIVDVYLYWAFGVGTKGGLDVSAYPHLSSLEDRLKVLPGFNAMLAEEERSLRQLAA